MSSKFPKFKFSNVKRMFKKIKNPLHKFYEAKSSYSFLAIDEGRYSINTLRLNSSFHYFKWTLDFRRERGGSRTESNGYEDDKKRALHLWSALYALRVLISFLPYLYGFSLTF